MQLIAAAMKPRIHSFCYVLLGFFFLCAFSLWICAPMLLMRVRLPFICAFSLTVRASSIRVRKRFMYISALSFLLRLPKLICELHRRCSCVSALSLLMGRRLIALLANALPRLSCAPFHSSFSRSLASLISPAGS